ncbi:MAG: polyphosphate kinase 1 [Gemmatimonadales bacterium]|nr:MAG: polyphosphate kinase 1 [Gemmatimonadales bacterium]
MSSSPITYEPAVRPAPVEQGVDLDHPSLYFNRELGWLDFNWRVFHYARHRGAPLLERVRFLAITAGNLDEFVQKRVGGLRRQEAAGVTHLSPDGRGPGEQLRLLRSEILRMQCAIDDLWTDELRPELESIGVRICPFSELTDEEKSRVSALFQDQIYPVLTPLAVDPGHPFPFISNLSLSLAVVLRHPERGTLHFARVKVPTNHTRRWIVLGREGAGEIRLVPAEEVIRTHIGKLFGSMTVEDAHLFRVIRNADIRRDEEEAEDLLAMISQELRERRFAPVVRLEVEADTPQRVRQLLIRELNVDAADVADFRSHLALNDLMEIVSLPLPRHKLEPWEPRIPPRLLHEGESTEEEDIFSIIRAGDVLVHHPYESFNASVTRLVEEAAADPEVLAIKQTLYRTSDDSRIVKALLRAAELGKEVAVLVEVKARFDEQNNIDWARMLENAGVHVAYGLVGLKTHAKAILVVRREEGRPRVYCHIGTGNYHAGNAGIYTDLGLLTTDPEIGADVVDLFHFLTGYAPDQDYRKLIVAPGDMRQRFYALIHGEIQRAQAGEPASIDAKMNALDDPGIIRKLYEASRAGVKIRLVVRGHCRLRPGVPGYSENIEVLSVLGRFLEHERIFRFGNGGSPLTLIGSADWRTRNLDERIEALAPVEDPGLETRISEILDLSLQDNELAWDLDSTGRYTLRTPTGQAAPMNLHRELMARTMAGERRGEGTVKP